jgi:hypothetical protein
MEFNSALKGLKTLVTIYIALCHRQRLHSAREVCCHVPNEPQTANSHCVHNIDTFSDLYSLCICSSYVSLLHLPLLRPLRGQSV